MSSASSLVGSSLSATGAFNWVFLVDLLVCGILALFFLFYFNRLFATFVSYGIRAWTWHKYRAYIDISALQVSLLGGRIFFKDVRYHAHNVTILVHDGMITWRYWLRLVQGAEVFEFEESARKGKERPGSGSQSGLGEEKAKSKSRSPSISRAEKASGKKKELPSRISIKVSAVEAFIYNQSPVYDNILEAALRKAKQNAGATDSEDEKAAEDPDSPSSSNGEAEKKNHEAFGVAREKIKTQDTGLGSVNAGIHQMPGIPSWLRILPVRIECKRAAAAVGNENTTSIITAKVEKAAGTIDAGEAGPLDYYRLLFNFDLEKVDIALKPNRDFKQHQLDAARRVLRDKEMDPEVVQSMPSKIAKESKRRWHRFAAFFNRRKGSGGSLRTASMKSVEDHPLETRLDQFPGQAQWRGLTRYLDDNETNEHNEWEHVEYAKASTLVDCDKINFKFYFDVPGTVPEGIVDNDTLLGSAYDDDINGSKPPEYGLEFGVYGGVVMYGPWADRQRVNLQHVFFPVSCVDAVPKKRLNPGETRAWTVFKIFVVVEEDVVLRIPTRESSKDERWQGRAKKSRQEERKEETGGGKRHGKHGKKQKHGRRQKGKQGTSGTDVRPYAWIDVTIKKDTTVNYKMDMFTREDGFRNYLDLDVKGTEMTSSVNHGLLWRAGALTLEADLSNPCTWNTLRTWPFTIVCDDLELFILRDHMFLITDVVNDWSSGPPAEFFTFVPYIYNLDLRFRNFVMYLNVNDANIINDPAELDRNDFLTLEGEDLHGVLGITLEHYRPKRSGIIFDVLSQKMRMRLLNPSRSTFNTLLKENEKQVAELPKLTLKGSYSANAETRVGLTDVLRMDLVGSGLNLKAFGFLVRLFIGLKENYFGDYIHFKTLEEFQGAGDTMDEAIAKTATVPKPQTANELDVILCIIVEDATVMFPTNLYSGENFVRAEIPVANLDLRVTSYYLDMGLNMSPVSIMSGSSINDEESPIESESSTQIYISHVDLYGMRAFGPPPMESAYACDWDIDVGPITGECSSGFIQDLALAGQAFIFAFGDGENILPVSSPNIFYDITFVQVRTDIVRLWLHIGKDALLFSSAPISVDTNDWLGETLSQRISVLAPLITFACVDGRSASRHRVIGQRKTPVRTYAFLQTGVAVDVVGRKANFTEARAKQQAYVRQNDLRTGRAPFLQHRRDTEMEEKYEEDIELDPPAMQVPGLPLPVEKSGAGLKRPASIKSMRTFATPRSMSHKSSSTSLSSSIRGPAAPAAQGVMFRPLGRQGSTRTSSSGKSSRAGLPISSDAMPPRVGTLPGDCERERFGSSPSTMAFSSSFSEPYFPLDQVEPDESNVPAFATVPDDADKASSETHSISDIAFDPVADEESERVSVLIKLVPGIRVYVEPRVAATAAKLIRKISPKDPESVMDAFQMKIMGEITAGQDARHGQKSVLEIQASLPSARLRVLTPSSPEEVGSTSTQSDQIDLTIRGLEQMVRVRTEPSATGAKQTLALHTVTESLEVSLSERIEGSEVLSSAVKVNIDDVLVWVAMASTTSIHVSIRDTNVAVSGDQAKYLALLALRILPLVEDIKTRFDETLAADRRRLMLLIYTLTRHGDNVGDPPFLSRMTYILRAFPDHFRNQESWKVLSRFRYILRSLPKPVRAELDAKCKTATFDFPVNNARAEILESWAQWRNWDVPNVGQTLVFRDLFGSGDRNMHAAEKKTLALTVRSEYLCITLSNGATASKVVMEDLSLAVEDSPPTMPTGLMLVEENERTKTQLQVNMSSIAIALDWSIYGIVEIVLPLRDKFQQFTAPAAQVPDQQHRSAGQVLEDEISRHDFHVVLSTDSGSISFQSLNLRHMSRADGLKMSLIGTTQAGEEYGQCVSALVNFDSAVTELRGPNSRIWQTLLTSPSLYVDHVHAIEGSEIPPSVTIAVAYNDLEIAVTEQVPEILHIVDSVVMDEVATIMRLIKLVTGDEEKSVSTQSAEAEKSTTATNSGNNKPTKFSLAVLAGKLHLEISLLSKLNYHLEGAAASVRVAPSMKQAHIFDIDFDVGRQKHSFVNLTGNRRHHQGIFELPPINGHVGLQTSVDETSVSVATTVEQIRVDAAAIQSVIGVVNRPEVQHIFSAIMGGIEDIRHHIVDLECDETSAPLVKTATTTISPDPKILFDVRFALLGIRVAASTPQIRGRSTAEVEFGIGPLHANASNRATGTESNPLVPQVHALIQDIGAKMWIDDESNQQPCGNVTLGLSIHFDSKSKDDGTIIRELIVQSESLAVNAYPETASTVVDVINHIQDRIRDLDLSKEVEYLRRLRDSRRGIVIQRIKGRKVAAEGEDEQQPAFSAADLLSVQTTVELRNIRISWLVGQTFALLPDSRAEDAVLTLASIVFQTHGGNEAKLTIQNLMLQLTPEPAANITGRSLNSALLPEIGFSVAYWSSGKNRSLAFKATGQPLDLRLESRFIVPVSAVQRSVVYAIEKFKSGTATWQSTPMSNGAPRAKMFDTKRLASLLVEADFAGAQVYMQGSGGQTETLASVAASQQQKKAGAQHGRYGQFAAEGGLIHTTLKAPGFALKVEYNNNTERQPTVNGELQIEASSNLLLPNVVPLVLEVSNSVKEVIKSQEDAKPKQQQTEIHVADFSNKSAQRFFEEESIITANPSAFFGKTKVDLGLRVKRQQFGLSCQPIARVDAEAALDDLYFTMNTIDSDDYGHFFAMSAVFTKVTAHVKHVYSRDPTFSYDMDSIVLSLMNSKHLSGVNGISAILKLNPTRISINGKQLQDLLLFREIWLPPEIRQQGASPTTAPSVPSAKPDDYIVQRYKTVAAAAAFPWNATVSIAKLAVALDLGQSIGKTSFTISDLWASQRKSSNWEQNLCIGMEEMAMTSTGRMSGFIELSKLGVRTSIKWPEEAEMEQRQAPLIQASIGFQRLRAKAAFDYQAFAFGDIEGFDFLMYNVRETAPGTDDGDRLVAVLDCEKAYVFCTSTSPAQAVGLYQAFDRLIQEKQSAYMQSLRDIEKHLRRASTVAPTRFGPAIGEGGGRGSPSPAALLSSRKENKSPISLHTDVVLALGTISFGVFPSTFFDSQILKLEANNVQARFAVGLEAGKIHSGLGMTLGQLQVALASVKRMTAVPKALDVGVDDVVNSALNAKGGIILRVPKVVASMQTWQSPHANHVDYLFKSLFDGKIDVGWNLARINFIKGMWVSHSRSLASRLGKALPESAVKITATDATTTSTTNTEEGGRSQLPWAAKNNKDPAQEKITAEVHLPQSKYEYRALEPPVIETPQLRDMGEATPPLEWIGLQRDRLPNVTHQIIIVSLLEIAREVEDAYARILGNS